MLKKNENILDKIVKRDYNNELEALLEKKYFSEDTKSILLSILYKLETSYKDYKQVKQDVETKEQIIETLIKNIKENCNEIKLVNPNSKESEMLKGKSFWVEKNRKIIFCYPIERKVLYCISKISQKDRIIKGKYFLIDKTLSDLITVGKNISTVEPLRDFNGYSWTTISREIESVDHNLIFQNLVLLLGNKFIDKWLINKEAMLDYMEIFINKMEEIYGKKNATEFIKRLKDISVLLEVKYDKESSKKIRNIKKEIEEKLEEIEDNKVFLEGLTKEKRKLTREIRKIDETINNKDMLQSEYEKRNEKLPLEEKIFSIRILSKLMEEERAKKIEQIEKINELMNPQKFVEYKRELENKQETLKILDTFDIEKDIEELKLQMQKIFLKCFKHKMQTTETKNDMLKLIYEFRYYTLLPYNYDKSIREVEELKKIIEDIERVLLKKAHDMKIIEKFSKQEDVDYELLKCIFSTRSINLEEIYVKLTKEKEEYFIQIFDGESFEDKIEIKEPEKINKRDLYIRLNKKVKAFY